MNFDQAFDKLVDPRHEGGYVNNPADPGGETKYGISKRAYPEVDIKNLTLDQAKALYLRDFWTPLQADKLPDLVRFELFDLAVNTSARGKPTQAVKLLQRALGVTDDGILGPVTFGACAAMDPGRLLRRLQAQRIFFYTSLASFASFGKGWVNRVATNMMEA